MNKIKGLGIIINIAGLAIALAASLLIVFYVQTETSYDKQWLNAERIYRVNNNFNLPGRAPYRLAITSSLLVPALQRYFPDEIAAATRARSMDLSYRVGDNAFKDVVVAVDATFADMFSLHTVQGNLANTLGGTAGIALSEDMALKLFGAVDVLDRIVTVEYQSGAVDYRVTAVYQKPAFNSVLELPALIKLDEAVVDRTMGTWNQAPVASYLQLKPGIKAEALSSRLNEFSDRTVNVSAMSPGPDTKASDRLFFDMSKLSDIHLDPRFQDVRGAGSRPAVQAFSVIAALIVLIACINFVSLTLARSGAQAAEVGIKKILGASKQQLLLQYLGRSLVQVAVALVLGLALVELLMPLFVKLLHMPLTVDYGNAGTYLDILVLYLVVALLVGLYPALVLSRYRPAAVLNACKAQQGKAQLTLRNGLLVFQFGVAIALIIATSVIYLQIEFISQRDPGFKQDHLIVISDLLARADVNAGKQALRDQIKTLPDVLDASLSSYHPMATTRAARTSSAHHLAGRAGEAFNLANAMVDENFFPTYNIALVAGRNFSLDQDRTAQEGIGGLTAADIAPRTAIINEAAVKFLGFAKAEDAIGQLFVEPAPQFAGVNYTYSIIGVAADNQFYSLKAATRPEVYFFHPTFTDVVTVSYQGNADAMLSRLQTLWRNRMGDAVFSASLIEPILAQEFSQQRREGQMLVVFSLFSIFIACLGLYGAAAFSIERRTKEIGIRKVMGAQVREILSLLLWQFSKPVLLANVLAWPVALWAMLFWLQQFPYQITTMLLIPLCALAAAIALCIAWLTVASNALRVASAKPVLALRYE